MMKQQQAILFADVFEALKIFRFSNFSILNNTKLLNFMKPFNNLKASSTAYTKLSWIYLFPSLRHNARNFLSLSLALT